MKYKTIRSYVKNIYEKQGMDISEEGLDSVTEAVTNYIKILSKITIKYKNHITLMEDDVKIALFLIENSKKTDLEKFQE